MKKLFAMLLSFCMVFAMMPLAVSAAEESGGQAAAEDAVITMDTVTAQPGDTVTVQMTIRNNPGILGMTLKLSYDESKVTLTGVSNGDALSYMTFTAPKNPVSGSNLLWDAVWVPEDQVQDGVLATLTFQVSENVQDDEAVEICVTPYGDIIDNDMQPLNIGFVNGSIRIGGDAGGSGEDENERPDEPAEYTVKWSSISTSLGGNIAMNFYVELSEDLVADPNAYIQFNFAGRTLKVALSEGKESQKNGVTVYQFSCPITSKNMTDEITAQVYNADGKVGEPKSMSVDTYCNWVIANFKDAKTVNLMKGMLNYGASAQLLFKYRTDDLANASLAEEDKVFGAVDASAYKHSVVGTEEGIIAKSMTLLLDSETTVRVYFELTGDKAIDQYTFTVDGVEVQPTFKDGKYYVERPNISAHRLDDMHVFTCGGITVTYGGLSYVNQVMTYYTEGATFDMASALYAYAKAAEAYIG